MFWAKLVNKFSGTMGKTLVPKESLRIVDISKTKMLVEFKSDNNTAARKELLNDLNDFLNGDKTIFVYSSEDLEITLLTKGDD